MGFHSNYQAPQANWWQGRHDAPPASSYFQMIKLLDLTKLPPAAASGSFALLGFCCDEGIRRNLGRTGAAEGPDVLRATLAKLPVHKSNLSLYDAGNIVCTDHDLEKAQDALAQAVYALLNNGYTPILIGGGHEIAWGHYQGIAKQFPKENLGIINFDTHFDMRPVLDEDKGSSGTPFLQIANAHKNTNRRFDYNCIGIQPYGNTNLLFNTAEQYQTKILSADDLQANEPVRNLEFIDRVLRDNDHIYLTLCLDVFSAAYAPGVSAPQAFGLTPWQLLPLIRQVAESGKVISYDIAELSPPYDHDARTAKLAANFIYEILHHHQHSSQTNR